jgi:uncharacterized membrane-anchored protein YhcB (DUF1043 family)
MELLLGSVVVLIGFLWWQDKRYLRHVEERRLAFDMRQAELQETLRREETDLKRHIANLDSASRKAVLDEQAAERLFRERQYQDEREDTQRTQAEQPNQRAAFLGERLESLGLGRPQG